MSFDIALTGINAINTQLETISNNIANSATYGFKTSRANFAAVVAGTQSNGSEVASMTQSMDIGGGLLNTGRAMDAAIQGRGFFVLRDTNGAYQYSRVGIFSADRNGMLVDNVGRRLQGYPITPGGTTMNSMGDLSLPIGQIPAQATTRMQYVGNLSSDWAVPTTPFNTADPSSYNGSMVAVVYDSLGAQHSMTQYFVKSAGNEVTVHYTIDGATLPATSTLNFGTDGQLLGPVGAVNVALGTPTDAEPLSIDIDYTGTTQFSGEATTTVNDTNGYASGTLTGVSLTEDGSVMAQYSNGQKQAVGRISLATFPNEGALTATSNTSWIATAESGAALYFTPGSGMAGKLTPGSVEQSNVDMTAELVDLMSAQRNYQANTKVIATESELMQSLMQAL